MIEKFLEHYGNSEEGQHLCFHLQKPQRVTQITKTDSLITHSLHILFVRPCQLSFCFYQFIKVYLVQVTNKFHVTKSKHHFQVFILLDLFDISNY